jgi:hypothetical protein
MSMSKLACNIGRGLAAGLVGTAAMTVSSTLEAKVRKREFSNAPAKAAEKVLGIREFESPQAESRFSNLVHWGYGTGWGAVRGILGSTPLSPKAATAAHGAAVWGLAAVMLPALEVSPPVTRWGKEAVAIDVLHHAVYATATGIAYELLTVDTGPLYKPR